MDTKEINMEEFKEMNKHEFTEARTPKIEIPPIYTDGTPITYFKSDDFSNWLTLND